MWNLKVLTEHDERARTSLYRPLEGSYSKSGSHELIFFENKTDHGSRILSRSPPEACIKNGGKTGNVAPKARRYWLFACRLIPLSCFPAIFYTGLWGAPAQNLATKNLFSLKIKQFLVARFLVGGPQRPV